MPLSRKNDILLNVIIPLLLGVLLYIFSGSGLIPEKLLNYVPDGLWAYAFISLLLIIWERKINAGWVIAFFFSTVMYEVLQHYKILAGTGDYFDVLVYSITICFSLFMNSIINNSKKLYDHS